jgi:uncharacterized protein
MLPELIEPKQLAREHKVLTGELPLALFTRAEGLLIPGTEPLNFNWAFSLDAHDQVFAVLTLAAELKLQCQRCEKPFVYPLQAVTNMKVVHSETEAEALSLKLQPLYVDAAGQCPAFPVLEDELILNIPEFPKHEKKDCDFEQNQAYYATPSNGSKPNTYKPFAELKVLAKEKK